MNLFRIAHVSPTLYSVASTTKPAGVRRWWRIWPQTVVFPYSINTYVTETSSFQDRDRRLNGWISNYGGYCTGSQTYTLC